MATNYISTHGMIWGEVNSAGVIRSYGHDALGSVIETYDGTGALENTYRYKPYGETLAKTGIAADPLFLWNGGNGYRLNGLGGAEYFVRNRVYSDSAAQWTSVDRYWPEELPYPYTSCSPTSLIDASGLLVANCCCVPISVTPSASPGHFQDDNNNTLYGWQVVWTVVIGWTWVSPTSNNQSGCGIAWTETSRLPGEKPQGPTTYDGNDSHVLAMGWKNCKQPGKCTQSYSVISTNTITDWPGSENPSGGAGLSCYEVDVTVTISGGAGCGSHTAKNSWKGCEIWLKGNTGTPDVQCPNGVTCK